MAQPQRPPGPSQDPPQYYPAPPPPPQPAMSPGWTPPGGVLAAPPPSMSASAPPTYATPYSSASAVYERKADHGFLLRAIYYLFVGWWLAGLGMLVAWLAAITIIGIPLAFWLINRVPTMLTLRPRNERYFLMVGADGVTREVAVRAEQSSFVVRALYFVFIGWWASGLWMIASYLLMLTIIGIPIGLMMANRLPFVFSLHRGYA